MTWIQFMQYYNSSITEELAKYILWNETGYPSFGTVRKFAYQIRSAIRSRKTGQWPLCDFCLRTSPLHKDSCYMHPTNKATRMLEEH